MEVFVKYRMFTLQDFRSDRAALAPGIGLEPTWTVPERSQRAYLYFLSRILTKKEKMKYVTKTTDSTNRMAERRGKKVEIEQE